VESVVVDASVMVEALIRPEFAAVVEAAVGRPTMVAPDLINVEVLSALRGLEHRKILTATEAERCLDQFLLAPIRRLGTGQLMHATWLLRKNVTAYDGTYLALAAQLRFPLVTRDARLARSAAVAVPVLVL
jgi:predicted nucleic acid-binding protein